MTARAAVPTAPAEPGRAGLVLPARRRLCGWSREMAVQRRELERDWTAALQAGGAISPPPGVAAAQHLADGGGFRVPATLEDQLPAAAKAFFDDRVVREGWLYLRGFGYYAADAHMYLPGRAPAPGQWFAAVQQRWPRPLRTQVSPGARGPRKRRSRATPPATSALAPRGLDASNPSPPTRPASPSPPRTVTGCVHYSSWLSTPDSERPNSSACAEKTSPSTWAPLLSAAPCSAPARAGSLRCPPRPGPPNAASLCLPAVPSR